MKFNPGDPVWVLSRFGHGMKAGTILPNPSPNGFAPCKRLKDVYNVEIMAIMSPRDDHEWSCQEWQLFPRLGSSPPSLELETTVPETDSKP